MLVIDMNILEKIKQIIKSKSFLLCIGLTVIIITRIISACVLKDVFYDEEIIIKHFESIIDTGNDFYGNKLPLFSTVGAGLTTYMYMYPMIWILSIIGVSALKARIVQQILTIGACIALSFGIKTWSKNKNLFWITLYVSLTLPWGFVQANRVWDPAFVPLYFSLHFLFFAKTLKKDTLKEYQKWLFPSLSCMFLVFLAIVYPPCRIPAVIMWIYTMYLFIKNGKLNRNRIFICLLVSFICAFPLALKILEPGFNDRTKYLLVFQGGKWYKEAFQWLKNTVNLFNPGFLFFSGDIIVRHSLPIYGMLGTISIVPLLYLFKQKHEPIFSYLLLIIIFTYLSVGLTNDYSPHGLRSCLVWMPYAILISYGWYLLLKDKALKIRIISYSIIGIYYVMYFIAYIAICNHIENSMVVWP